MNYKMIRFTIGQILKVEAILMILPLIISFIYSEKTYLSFLIPILSLLVIGFSLTIKKPKKQSFYAREGFIIVGLSWIIMSIFGALPFVISKEIPNFTNAFFETVSGFTTTGASILDKVEVMTKGMLFWRSFTHWIGGMGVLVFVLAILPNTDGKSIHLLRAESPGPQVGKLVAKIRFTARILYCIYIALTLLQVIFLVCGEMNLYESFVHTFATAGTGGFSIKSDSIASYSTYSQIVIAIFMVIFGINFNIFFLILIGNFKQIFKNEELRWYLGIIIFSTIFITLNIYYQISNSIIGVTIKDAFFQVSSIMTTTGFSTVDFNLWPVLSKTILIFLMFIGASAGSTGGGLKVSRFVILFKSMAREMRNLLHPRSVTSIRIDGKPLDESIVKSVNIYFITFITIFFGAVFLISIEGRFDFETNFSAVAACINNIGPGLGGVGPLANFNGYTSFSKIVLALTMLIGRLEIFPIIMLFSPRTYSRQ